MTSSSIVMSDRPFLFLPTLRLFIDTNESKLRPRSSNIVYMKEAFDHRHPNLVFLLMCILYVLLAKIPKKTKNLDSNHRKVVERTTPFYTKRATCELIQLMHKSMHMGPKDFRAYSIFVDVYDRTFFLHWIIPRHIRNSYCGDYSERSKCFTNFCSPSVATMEQFLYSSPVDSR